jgi:hypothetical protein
MDKLCFETVLARQRIHPSEADIVRVSLQFAAVDFSHSGFSMVLSVKE